MRLWSNARVKRCGTVNYAPDQNRGENLEPIIGDATRAIQISAAREFLNYETQRNLEIAQHADNVGKPRAGFWAVKRRKEQSCRPTRIQQQVQIFQTGTSSSEQTRTPEIQEQECDVRCRGIDWSKSRRGSEGAQQVLGSGVRLLREKKAKYAAASDARTGHVLSRCPTSPHARHMGGEGQLADSALNEKESGSRTIKTKTVEEFLRRHLKENGVHLFAENDVQIMRLFIVVKIRRWVGIQSWRQFGFCFSQSVQIVNVVVAAQERGEQQLIHSSALSPSLDKTSQPLTKPRPPWAPDVPSRDGLPPRRRGTAGGERVRSERARERGIEGGGVALENREFKAEGEGGGKEAEPSEKRKEGGEHGTRCTVVGVGVEVLISGRSRDGFKIE
ncbi:hypothetical protein C8R44DRAFT_929413 [Mycena epipterygia]|nr:hypothetical protein C8R44DRAFT_929413 [Mycena epipterygia]